MILSTLPMFIYVTYSCSILEKVMTAEISSIYLLYLNKIESNLYKNLSIILFTGAVFDKQEKAERNEIDCEIKMNCLIESKVI